jgi:hypothetical protein
MNYLLWASLGFVVMLGRFLHYGWWQMRRALVLRSLRRSAESIGHHMVSMRLGDPYLLTLIAVAPADSAERTLLLQLLGLTVLANVVPPLQLEGEYARGRPIYVAHEKIQKHCALVAQNLWPRSPGEKLALASNVALLLIIIGGFFAFL